MKRRMALVAVALGLATAAFAAATVDENARTLIYSTAGSRGELDTVEANSASLTLTLTNTAFDRTITLDDGSARPINFNPSSLTVSSIALGFVPRTDNTYPQSFTVGEETFTQTSVGAETTVTDADGMGHAVVFVTYEGSATLATGGAYTLSGLGATGVGTEASLRTVDEAIHAVVTGTARLTRHVIEIADGGTHSLEDELGGDFADGQDTVVVVEFSGNGGTLTLDKTLTNSPFVAGSSVSKSAAEAVLQFADGVSLTGPFTLRDGTTDGGITLQAPASGGGMNIWNPADFLLLCDLTLAAPLPASPEGTQDENKNWFEKNIVPIPAGRTVRLELPANTAEGRLPNLAFAAEDSTLELATGLTDIPAKYRSDLGASGILVLNQNVAGDNLRVGDTGYPGTVIFRGDHMWEFPALMVTGNSAAVIQEAGALTLTGTTRALQLLASSADITVAGGTFSVGGLSGMNADTATRVNVTGGTLAMRNGLAAGADNSGAFLLTVNGGTLDLGDDLNMVPAARRSLTLNAGTINGTGNAVKIVTVDANGTGEDNFMTVGAGQCALTGNLGVDEIRGLNGGTLALDADVVVNRVRDFTGTLYGEGRVVSILGSSGEVTLGDPWGTAEGKTLADLANTIAADYHGTLGFTAGTSATNHKDIDFSAVEGFTELPGAFRINNNQHITMRLDQYADATIRWPANPEGIKLTLIESGAYGGEITLPHIPDDGVTLDFAHFPTGAAGEVVNEEDGLVHRVENEDFTIEPDESGVTDTLEWENQVFTGEGAWIDVEFNGDTKNTGWFTLTGQDGSVETDGRTNNGLLCGLTPGQNPFGNKVMYGSLQGTAAADYFTSVRHPRNDKGGLALYYRPYVAMKSSLVYPETWSLSVRFTAPVAQRRYESYGDNQGEWLPAAGHRCLVAFGNNDNTEHNPEWDNCNALVLATGDTDNEIVLYRFSGRNETKEDPDDPRDPDDLVRPAQPATEQPPEVLFRQEVADATSAAHTVSVVYDGDTMTFYLDGAYVASTEPGALDGFRLGRGLQVGAQLGGHGVAPDAFWSLAYPPSEAEGGVIDYLRFYKGALTDTAMQEIADRTPYVRENLRYVRYVPITSEPNTEQTVPDGGETWVQPNAWVEERYADGAWASTGTRTDEPAEGAECRLLVAKGEYVIQVNVERNVNPDADKLFYSPNRNYATLVVAPQDGQTEAGTVRLTPLGVTEKEVTAEGNTNTEWEKQVVAGDWYKTTEAISEGNRTGFTYGRLRFTGGADDPINADSAIPDFHGSAYLLSGGETEGESSSVTGDRTYGGDIAWDEAIAYTFASERAETGTATQKGTRTYTYTVTTTTAGVANPSVTNGVYDAGVCVFSKYANMVVDTFAVATTTVTTYTGTQTVTRTASATREVNVDYILGFIPVYTPIEGSEVHGAWSEQGNGIDNGDERVTGEQTTAGGGETLTNRLRLVAGLALTRGERDEVVDWQLTGPVVVEGADMEAENLPNVSGNDADADETQASLDVWVPKFGADADWKFYDITRTTAADNANGHGTGLFARAVQTPGRLYLDFTQPNGAGWYEQSGGAFSAQAWYRYGYEGTPAAATRSGMVPTPISATDFDNAVAFQIRLSTDVGDVTLNLDKVPTSEIGAFAVEDDAADTAEKLPTLFLTTEGGTTEEGTTEGGGTPLTIHDLVVAAARLDVANNGGAMALDLEPNGTPIPVHKGTSKHGAFIVGTATIDWDFGAISSVPRLEVAKGCTLTLSGAQDFRTHGNTLVAQDGATIAQTGTRPLRGTDVELGEGATFAFQAESAVSGDAAVDDGVVLSGALTLLGKTATLSGSRTEGATALPHFTALGGIVAEQPGATLTVDAPKATDSWHSHTVALTGAGFGLTKTGAGTVDFYATTAPTVSGPVRVEAGTLRVVPQANGTTTTPIGANDLHVAAGATLAASARKVTGAGYLLAHIPSGATLSGGGRVDGGLVRLDSGATYTVVTGEALTSVAGFLPGDNVAVANIIAALPEGYTAHTVFLKSGRREPNESPSAPNVRRRILSQFTNSKTRWDTVAHIVNGGTEYYAQPASIPEPTDLAEGAAEPEYANTLENALIDHYRGEGMAYIGTSQGRTKASTQHLNASEIGEAIICFGNILAFSEKAPGGAATQAEGEEYVDARNLYVAYEFGISAMAFATLPDEDGAEKTYVVVEVKVRNDLANAFEGILADTAEARLPAIFRESTRVYLTWADTDEENVDAEAEVTDAVEVTDLTGATPGTASAADTRYFRVPYDEARFPEGALRQLRAHAALQSSQE